MGMNFDVSRDGGFGSSWVEETRYSAAARKRYMPVLRKGIDTILKKSRVDDVQRSVSVR